LSDFSNLEVRVVGNDLEKAMRVLKKNLHRDGVFRRLKAKRGYEKPNDCRRRKRRESESGRSCLHRPPDHVEKDREAQ